MDFNLTNQQNGRPPLAIYVGNFTCDVCEAEEQNRRRSEHGRPRGRYYALCEIHWLESRSRNPLTGITVRRRSNTGHVAGITTATLRNDADNFLCGGASNVGLKPFLNAAIDIIDAFPDDLRRNAYVDMLLSVCGGVGKPETLILLIRAVERHKMSLVCAPVKGGPDLQGRE